MAEERVRRSRIVVDNLLMPRRAHPAQASLTRREFAPILTDLRAANRKLARAYPGEPDTRGPVHTVYGGAHLFRASTVQKLGALALAALDEYAPDEAAFAQAFGLEPGGSLPATVRARIVQKLRTEPIEDYRLDFEDGYGHRSDDEEDGHARSAAVEVAAGLEAGTLPPFIGIRIKPLSRELHVRSLRTLDLFVTALVRETAGRIPPHFVITVPKVMSPGHVAAVARACDALERRLRLGARALTIELMIETPQAILGPTGRSALLPLVAAGRGRVTGAHFGTYDYTALCGITAFSQHMRHPACDFAKHMMQVALAQTGVRLSDGATTVMPIGPHRATADRPLTAAERRENREVVHRAWRAHYEDVRHSLVHGYYQGWDLHPAQLPSRYAALYVYFLAARSEATERLRHFIDTAARATLVGNLFDDAATGQGLLNFFVRGVNAGALTLAEARETGLSAEELHGRSFLKIVEGRTETVSRGSGRK